MPRPTIHRPIRVSDISILPLAVFLALPLVSTPSVAQHHEQDERVTVERPVVVVRTGQHHTGVTWSVEGHHSFLGVQTLDLTPELRTHFGVPSDNGVLVSKVVEESPAEESGLLVGDIISGVDGEAVSSPTALAMAIRHGKTGDVVDLEVWRDGQVLTVQPTLAERQGPWVDIRQFRVPEEGAVSWEWKSDELEDAIELETETLNLAIERLNREMDSPEWHERVHVFQQHQGTLMKRIETLEKRLRELEAELEGLSERD